MATVFDLAARLQAAGAAEGMLLIVLKATLILVMARLLLAAMPHAAGATRHIVATAALVAVGLMPVFTVLVPAWEIVVDGAEKTSAAPAITAVGPGSPAPVEALDAAQNSRPAVRTTDAVLSVARATGLLADQPLTAMERAMNIGRSTWKGMIALAVGLLALLMLAQMTVGMLGVWLVSRKAEELTLDSALMALDHARDRLALKLEVRLLRSSRISVPVIWGVAHPVLLLPADVVTWPEERLRVVLMHELAHLKRFDGISLLLTRTAVSFFWFHPLAWSLERAGRSECERACDDLVLASGTKPSDYADHLLAIARSMPTFDPFRSVTLAMSRKSQLEGRLLSILQPHVARRVFSGRGVAIACALAIAVIVPLSAIRLTAGPPDAKKVAGQREETARKKTNATVTVTPELEAIQDYLFTKLGKYDKRADTLARQPRDGKEWYERAYDFYHADRLEEAAAAFRRAADEGYREATSYYNEACSYALLGDANRAIPALQQALRAGWDDIDHIAEDSDFDPIRSDPRFAQVVSTNEQELVTRRVKETEQRYKEMQDRARAGVAGGIAGGVEGGIADGVKGGVRDGVRDAVRHGLAITVNGEHFKFDFNGNDSDWFDVGLDLLRLRKLDQSIDAFRHSIAANRKTDTSMYNIACAYSLKGDVRGGMEWLDKAIEAGFSSDDKLENDPDIALLRQRSGFEALQRKTKDLQLRGCCDTGNKWLNAFVSDNWRDAAGHHREIANRYPNSGRAWFNLGFTSLRAEDYATALQSFHRAIDLGHRLGTSSYNIACAYALQGDRDAAFEWLGRARTAGFELENYLTSDDDLDSLHRDPRYKALREELNVRERNRKHKDQDDENDN
jgi:beta-lactamase regulating signal transducer with metallopeptidase domain/Flp pilus assembly protein TadD